uniref:Uncharacterized protein n=1 Tax=Malurus cyaneus samueli TaxID=2593467 RepID=A0A8C5UBC1_9PASS
TLAYHSEVFVVMKLSFFRNTNADGKYISPFHDIPLFAGSKESGKAMGIFITCSLEALLSLHLELKVWRSKL